MSVAVEEVGNAEPRAESGGRARCMGQRGPAFRMRSLHARLICNCWHASSGGGWQVGRGLRQASCSCRAAQGGGGGGPAQYIDPAAASSVRTDQYHKLAKYHRLLWSSLVGRRLKIVGQIFSSGECAVRSQGSVPEKGMGWYWLGTSARPLRAGAGSEGCWVKGSRVIRGHRRAAAGGRRQTTGDRWILGGRRKWVG